MGVVMKGRERMWVEDIRCKGMGVVMKGRERKWIEDIRCKGMGVVMKGRERMWKNECVSIDLFIHVIFCLLIDFEKCNSQIIIML